MTSAGVRLRAWAGILLIAVCGCGTSEYSSTEGVIKLDGIPLANATVFFCAPNMPPAAATTDESGRYRVETGGTIGMMPGEYSVTVAAYRTDSYGRPIPMLVIPKRYLRPESSGLKASISTGTNRGVDFELNTDRSALPEPSANGLDRTSSFPNWQTRCAEWATEGTARSIRATCDLRVVRFGRLASPFTDVCNRSCV